MLLDQQLSWSAAAVAVVVAPPPPPADASSSNKQRRKLEKLGRRMFLIMICLAFIMIGGRPAFYSRAGDDDPLKKTVLLQEGHQQMAWVEQQPPHQPPISSSPTNVTKQQQPSRDLVRPLQPQPRPKTQQKQIVFHIGPPKTATTTIQEILTTFDTNKILEADNYTYTGAFRNKTEPGLSKKPLRVKTILTNNNECTQKMTRVCKSQSNNSDNASSSSTPRLLFEELSRIPCVKKIIQALDKYKQKPLLISDETLSFKNNAKKLRCLLSFLNHHQWDVYVILGYRRYFDWLPSAKQQVDRWTPAKPKMNKWIKDGGRKITPLFHLDYWQIEPAQNGKLPYFYTLDMVQLLKDTTTNVTIRILNMHAAKTSVPTSFFCDALPFATNSCQRSRLFDETLEQGEIKSNPTQTTFYYDTLTLAAEQANLIKHIVNNNNNKPLLRRRHVGLAAQQYMEVTLNQTYRDFPKICPTQTDYETFLNMSLRYELAILPEFYHSNAGKLQHETEFWKNVQQEKYCRIDTDQVLQDPKWRSFFASIGT